MHGIRPLGLQPPLYARVLFGKGTQPGQVTRAQRLQVPQHQRRDRVTTGQFDLRASLDGLERADQRTQRHKHGAHMRRQHRADFHVGHVTALALMEPDEYRALLAHMAHRQAGTVAVAPGRAFDGPQDRFRLHLAQVPEVVLEHPLLHRDLGGRVQVLHLAATAGARVQAEVRTSRTHTLGGLAMDRRDNAGFPVVLAAMNAGADLLEGQRALDEHDLAIGPMGDALGFDIEGLNEQPVRRHFTGFCGFLCHASIVREVRLGPSLAPPEHEQHA